MVSAMETALIKLQELGFFTFILPFLLVAAIFYGLLRKSQVFGKPEENIAVNAIVALIAGFMVWAYPIIGAASAGVDVERLLSEFFFKSTMITLVVMLGLLIAGMFMPPDLPSKIGEKLGTGKGLPIILVGSILVVGVAAAASGVLDLFIPAGFAIGGVSIGAPVLDQTTLLSIVMIVAMSGAVIGIVWGGGKAAKP